MLDISMYVWAIRLTTFSRTVRAIDVTNCARDPKPLTHCLTSSPRYHTYKQRFFRLTQTERDRERETGRVKN